MSFFIQHRYGSTTRDPPFSAFRALLNELNDHPEDQEHCDVAVIHESEWCLGAYRGGYVVWENVERSDSPPRHMRGVSDEDVIRLWTALARGDLATIEAERWLPGY
jgi:hypothetical protein